eukprot:1373412-Pleurochrysis_carterae.AAC.1
MRTRSVFQEADAVRNGAACFGPVRFSPTSAVPLSPRRVARLFSYRALAQRQERQSASAYPRADCLPAHAHVAAGWLGEGGGGLWGVVHWLGCVFVVS